MADQPKRTFLPPIEGLFITKAPRGPNLRAGGCSRRAPRLDHGRAPGQDTINCVNYRPPSQGTDLLRDKCMTRVESCIVPTGNAFDSRVIDMGSPVPAQEVEASGGEGEGADYSQDRRNPGHTHGRKRAESGLAVGVWVGTNSGGVGGGGGGNAGNGGGAGQGERDRLPYPAIKVQTCEETPQGKPHHDDYHDHLQLPVNSPSGPGGAEGLSGTLMSVRSKDDLLSPSPPLYRRRLHNRLVTYYAPISASRLEGNLCCSDRDTSTDDGRIMIPGWAGQSLDSEIDPSDADLAPRSTPISPLLPRPGHASYSPKPPRIRLSLDSEIPGFRSTGSSPLSSPRPIKRPASVVPLRYSKPA